MKKAFTLLALLATILVACTSEPKPSHWIHVEGNKFIDADGKEIIFRGLCYSDPVKLINDNQRNEK